MHKNAIKIVEGVKKNSDITVALFWAHFGKIVVHFNANLLVTIAVGAPLVSDD